MPLFRLIIATYGYHRFCRDTRGMYRRREEVIPLTVLAPGAVTINNIGLGWPRWWRVVETDIEEHDEGRGAVVAGCVPVEEQ